MGRGEARAVSGIAISTAALARTERPIVFRISEGGPRHQRVARVYILTALFSGVGGEFSRLAYFAERWVQEG